MGKAIEHMKARDWFDSIRADVLKLADMERDLEDLRAQTGPHGQQLGSIGHGSGGGDVSAPVLRVVQAEAELDVARAKLSQRIEQATLTLYGRDGRGGVARVRGYLSADCLVGYYLQGMSWAEVADEYIKPDSSDPVAWCKMRTKRALDIIDRYGPETLANL